MHCVAYLLHTKVSSGQPARRGQNTPVSRKHQARRRETDRYGKDRGYDPKYTAEYDCASTPTFAVGEYLDSNPNTLTAWVDGTKQQGQPDPALKACCAFDFVTYELLKHFINNGLYNHLPAITWKDAPFLGTVERTSAALGAVG